MKEAYLGLGVVIFGLFGLVILQLFQNITNTDSQIFYLAREAAQASMYDSLDVSYYKETGKIKIDEEKFIESFSQRFVESSSIKTKVVISDIILEPPKVNIEIGNNVISLYGDNFLFSQYLDGILETKYEEIKFILGDVNEDGVIDVNDVKLIREFINYTKLPSKKQRLASDMNKDRRIDDFDVQILTNLISTEITKEDLNEREYFDFICFPEYDFNCYPELVCLEGDLKAKQWSSIEDFHPTTSNAKPLKRKVTYEECINNKWVEKSETAVSTYKTKYNNVLGQTIVEHTWTKKISTEYTTKTFDTNEYQIYTSVLDVLPPTITFLQNINAPINNNDYFSIQDNGTGLLRARYNWSSSNTNSFVNDNECTSFIGIALDVDLSNNEKITSKATFQKSLENYGYLSVCAIDIAGNVSKEMRNFGGGTTSEEFKFEFLKNLKFYQNGIVGVPTKVATVTPKNVTVRYRYDITDYGFYFADVSAYNCSGGELATINNNGEVSTKDEDIKGNGDVVLHMCAEDNTGQIIAITKEMYLDSTSPTDLTLNPKSQNWINEDGIINLNAIDFESGIAKYKYCTTTGTSCIPSTEQTTNQITLSTTGEHMVCFQAQNEAGIWSETQCSDSKAYKIVKTKPTSLSLNPKSQNWTSSNIKITMNATDTESGISKYKYCTTTGTSCTPSTEQTTNQITLSTTGEHMVCFQAQNEAGIWSDESCSNSKAYKIDKTKPTDLSLNPTKQNWTNNIEITLNATDSESGILNYMYCTRTTGVDCTPSGEETTTKKIKLNITGEYKVCFQAQNKAGTLSNVHCSEAYAYKIDTTKPSINVTNASDDWFKTRITVITSTDTHSKLKEIRYQWNTNTMNAACSTGGTVITSGTSLTVPEGSNRLYVCSRDNAGNVQIYDSTANKFRVDTIGPSIKVTNVTNNWFTSTTTTITATDSGSGLREIRYNWDSNTMNAACSTKGTIIANGASLAIREGSTILYICARDNNGNVQTFIKIKRSSGGGGQTTQ